MVSLNRAQNAKVSQNGEASPEIAVRQEGSIHVSLLLSLYMGGEERQQEEQAMITLAKERLAAAGRAGKKDSVQLCEKHVSVLERQAAPRRTAGKGGYTHGLVAVALQKVRNVYSVALLP